MPFSDRRGRRANRGGVRRDSRGLLGELHATLHELLHGLGFRGHSDIVKNSVLGERSAPLIELPLNDKIIVRTLYDPRITPGMPREEALEVAREVIRELVDGVRRHGVEALYQRPSKSPQP